MGKPPEQPVCVGCNDFIVSGETYRMAEVPGKGVVTAHEECWDQFLADVHMPAVRTLTLVR